MEGNSHPYLQLGFYKFKSGTYAPINGLPQDGGVAQPRGNLTFSGFQCQFPHPWVTIISQIPTPGDHKL